MVGLIRLFAGEAGKKVHCNMSHVAEIRTEFEQFICNIFDGYLSERLSLIVSGQKTTLSSLMDDELVMFKATSASVRLKEVVVPTRIIFPIRHYSITRKNI